MNALNNKKLREAFKSLQVKSSQLVATYQEGYIGKSVYKVTLEDGSVRMCERILKNKRDGDAVVIIPITADGNFVMVIQSRPNTKENVVVEFPAGMVDEGEETIEAAKRELLEETGYVAEKINELEWHYQDQGCSRAIIRTYIAEGCRKVQEKELDGNEKLECVEMDYGDVMGLLRQEDVTQPRISDANSKIAILEYSLRKVKA